MADVRIALLRGINVGRAKRVAMADLRAIVEGLGYRQVRTLLNSGNVVFTVPPHVRGDAGARIEQALVSGTGVSSRVTVFTAAELGDVVRDYPLADFATDASRALVAFLARPSDLARVRPLLDERWDPERLALGRRVAYLWCPDGISASRLPVALGGALGDAVTTRNWATVLKLERMCAGG